MGRQVPGRPLGLRTGPLEELAEVHEGSEHQDKVFLMVLSSCSRKENDFSIPGL